MKYLRLRTSDVRISRWDIKQFEAENDLEAMKKCAEERNSETSYLEDSSIQKYREYLKELYSGYEPFLTIINLDKNEVVFDLYYDKEDYEG